MRQSVLITGASSGIGLEMAKELAAQHYDLVLVARREDRLVELKVELEARYGTKVAVFRKDLSEAGSAGELYEAIKANGLRVDMLINNAGVGLHGSFIYESLAGQMEMINLNIVSLVVLTHLCVRDFVMFGKGRVMNMASLLSFFPFPYFSVYAATKAFVLSFSEAIRSELEGTGVTITALCPGPVDSSFTTPAMAATNAYQRLRLTDPVVVARKGIRAMLAGKGTVTIGLQNKILASTPRFSPRRMTVRINKFMASAAGKVSLSTGKPSGSQAKGGL